MNRRLKIALATAGGVLLLVVAFLVGRAVSGDDDKSVAAGPGTTTSSSSVAATTSTTAVAAPATTSGEPAPTVAPPPTAAPVGTVVTAAGAFLEEAPQPTLHSTMGPDTDCTALADGGWTLDGCAPVDMAGGTRVWLTEYRPSGALKEWQVFVLHWSQGKGAWLVDLQLGQTMGIAQVNVRQLDLNGDGKPDMLFGFHLTGSGSYFLYDIVDGSGPGALTVATSRGVLSHGHAVAVPGRITDFEAKYPNGEPNCCPAYIQASEVTYSAGAYRVVEVADPGIDPNTDPGAF